MDIQSSIDKLRSKVERLTSVTQGTTTLISEMSDKIRLSSDDPTELEELANALDAQADALVAAILSNTPAAAVEPAPAPVPEPVPVVSEPVVSEPVVEEPVVSEPTSSEPTV